jgi:thymidine phosphorylase
MDQVLGSTAGNALEMREAIDFLTGHGRREPRLEAVTLALAGEMLALGGQAEDAAAGQAVARRALDSGAAAERFERMVAALGGPRSVLSPRFAGLPRARVELDLPAPRAGLLAAMDTREIGLVVVDLGGGRRVASDVVDPAVGLSQLRPLGTRVGVGDALMRVHARGRAQAEAALERLQCAVRIEQAAPPRRPVLIERMAAPGKPRGRVIEPAF